MKTLNEYKKTISILYIEDDITTSRKLQSILSKFFMNVYTALNGEEAYELISGNKKKVDLIISDINMPKMDGLEFLEKIRSKNNKIPFIFVTARNEPDKMLKAIQLDIDNYILKPIDLDNLLSTIDGILKKEFDHYLKVKEQNLIKLNDDLVWKITEKSIFLKDEQLKLTKKELLLIDLLLKEPNKIYTLDEIIGVIWNDIYESRDFISNLKNLISRLKRKIPELNIENIYGLGYKISIMN